MRLTLLLLLAAANLGVSERDLKAFYHTTEQLKTELAKLVGNCAGNEFTLGSVDQNGANLPVVEIKSPHASGKKLKVLFYFGEHARELISPETSLAWARHLCGQDAKGNSLLEHKERAAGILSKADIRFYPVVNVHGRQKVEQGEWCKRTNENDVDLNRNWPDHWGGGQGETNSGPAALSEIETQALKTAAEAYRPHMFVTIHSGTLGMYTPHAYSLDFPRDASNNLPSNVEEMVQILSSVNKKYCNCDTGAAGKEVGYLCPGTCLDYMYDKLKVSYSFAFEIYEQGGGFNKGISLTSLFEKSIKAHAAGPVDHTHSHESDTHTDPIGEKAASKLKARSCFLVSDKSEEAQPHADMIEMQTKLKSDATKWNMRSRRLDSMLSDQTHQGTKTHGEAYMKDMLERRAFTAEPDSCFYTFNPSSSEEYDAAVKNWANAFNEVIEGVIKTEEKDGFFL